MTGRPNWPGKGKMSEYYGKERRTHVVLTEEQEESIAERAVDKIWEALHIQIGKVVFRAMLLGGGAALLTFFLWAVSQGKIRLL
jgi:hypothetical protein